MNYLEAIEVAKNMYDEAMLSAKETWVKSPNTRESSESYNASLSLAKDNYDRAVATAQSKYLNSSNPKRNV